MAPYDTYNTVRNLATDAAHAELKFWRNVVEAYDADAIDIEAVRRLVAEHEWHITRTMTMPSRATAYRRLDHWRSVIADLSNPGRGA